MENQRATNVAAADQDKEASMTRLRQRTSARKNIQKAQGRGRKKPGATGKGRYYHIAVRPKSEFSSFRTQDVGKAGHIQRVAGRRSSGSWATATWLISKEDAHIDHGRLVPDTRDARKVLGELGSTPRRLTGDRFDAKPRPNVAERAKPTAAQKRARSQNIRKAQASRRRKT